MTTLQQIQQEIATLADEESMAKVLEFIRFLKWERGDYANDPRLSEEEKRDGLSSEWRQDLLAEQAYVRRTGELYSFQEVFGAPPP